MASVFISASLSFAVSFIMMVWHTRKIGALLEKQLLETNLLYQEIVDDVLEAIRQHRNQ